MYIATGYQTAHVDWDLRDLTVEKFLSRMELIHPLKYPCSYAYLANHKSYESHRGHNKLHSPNHLWFHECYAYYDQDCSAHGDRQVGDETNAVKSRLLKTFYSSELRTDHFPPEFIGVMNVLTGE
jgi:hypothetical protein